MSLPMRHGLPLHPSRRLRLCGHGVAVAARRRRHQAGFGGGQDRRVARVPELVFQLQGISIHAVRWKRMRLRAINVRGVHAGAARGAKGWLRRNFRRGEVIALRQEVHDAIGAPTLTDDGLLGLRIVDVGGSQGHVLRPPLLLDGRIQLFGTTLWNLFRLFPPDVLPGDWSTCVAGMGQQRLRTIQILRHQGTIIVLVEAQRARWHI
mmetsp:Transcript_82209/g.129943  ORF Transcript_82209/g.129943 Transcript_82209/m.129943 type:complete len:207 (-) Transcript_82209:268-888(-)